MKRMRVSALVWLLLAAAAGAQTLDSLVPKDAETMAMGGAFVASPSGWKSMFSNPAGFATSKFGVGVDLNAWGYIRPSIENIQAVIRDFENDGIGSVLARTISDNGIGAGSSIEAGVIGGGIVLAGYAITDFYMQGKNILGASGDFDAELGAVIGLGIPIDFFGLKLAIGGDVRPNYRINKKIDYHLVGEIMNQGGSFQFMSTEVNYGFVLAVDLGALLTVGPFDFGLAVRNISTPGKFSTGTLSDALGTIGKNTGGETTPVWSYPDIAIGMAYRPDMGKLKFWFDPKVMIELRDPIPVINEEKTPWTLLHIGAEARILSVLIARAGINAGYLSAGIGVDLFFVKVEAAVFTEELGLHVTERPRSGCALGIKVGL